jgi:hypothetical protein
MDMTVQRCEQLNSKAVPRVLGLLSTSLPHRSGALYDLLVSSAQKHLEPVGQWNHVDPRGV